jgi:3-hydroxybutyryl-CoA dehydrogenase
VEDLEVKRQLFAELENIVGVNCILATNTSSFSVTAIAAALRSAHRLLGMHFFNPVALMELVEVIGGLATGPEFLATVHATAAAWGKTPVYAKSTPGFIVNRVARPYYGEALLLLAEQAASPATIDAVMRESGGFRMGPFELMDLVGLDVGFAVSQSIFGAYFGDPRYRPSLIQQEMVRAGFLGRKTKRGFYEYDEDASAPTPDAEPPAPRPQRVGMLSAGSLSDALAKRLAASGVTVDRANSLSDHGDAVEVGGAILAVTDGRSATQRACESGHRNLVVVDLAVDFSKVTHLAITKASGCDERAYLSAVGLLQAAGYAVSRLKDVPGVVVMRTVAMLVNEAADVVNQGIATVADVDTAMRKGVNYPRGPLAWADELGMQTIQNVLVNLALHYGGDRYRVSPKIRQLVWNGGTFWSKSAG